MKRLFISVLIIFCCLTVFLPANAAKLIDDAEVKNSEVVKEETTAPAITPEMESQKVIKEEATVPAITPESENSEIQKEQVNHPRQTFESKETKEEKSIMPTVNTDGITDWGFYFTAGIFISALFILIGMLRYKILLLLGLGLAIYTIYSADATIWQKVLGGIGLFVWTGIVAKINDYKCSQCNAFFKRDVISVDEIASCYKYSCKDGSRDLRYNDNPLIIKKEYKYKCRKCGNETTKINIEEKYNY